MKNTLKVIALNLFILISMSSFAKDSNTFLIETNRGNITIEVYPEKANHNIGSNHAIGTYTSIF